MQHTDTILFCASQPILKIYEIGTKALSSYPHTREAEVGRSEVPDHSGLQSKLSQPRLHKTLTLKMTNKQKVSLKLSLHLFI